MSKIWGNLVAASYSPLGGPPPGRVPVSRPKVAMQGRLRTQDAPGKVKYSCSLCEIQYYLEEGYKAQCPLCEQLVIVKRLRDSLHEMTNANNMVLNENERLKTQVDTLAAMRIALETISPEDLAFIKSVLYRWQADRNKVALKPTHAAPKGRKKRDPMVDGFVAMFRGSAAEAEVHQCNSIGGLALAGYLQEAIALVGQVKAIEVLARAVVATMPADVEA